MKKLWLLLVLSFVMIFAGCANQDEEASNGKIRSSVEDSHVDIETDAENEPTDDNKEKEISKKEEEVVKASEGSIDDSYLKDIGKTVDDIEEHRGELSEFYWEDGPIYRFGSGMTWYEFDSYEYSDNNECIPKGTCNGLNVPMKDLIKGTSKYNADTLEGITGNEFTISRDEMYGMNVFVIEYKNYEFSIYAETRSDITENSVVGVERK